MNVTSPPRQRKVELSFQKDVYIAEESNGYEVEICIETLSRKIIPNVRYR